MFVFLVGGLGVLSLFPVAMNNAKRVVSEERGIILSQSDISQVTADCRVNCELTATGPAAAATNAGNTSLVRSQAPISTTPRTYYFVTLLDGPGRGQSRLIVNDPGGTGPLTVAPAWTPVVVIDNLAPPNQHQTTWTAPGSLIAQVGGNPCFPTEHYSISRMGLPERPISFGEQIQQSPGPYFVQNTLPSGYSCGTYGLIRDLAVRSFSTASGGSFTGLASGFAPNGFFAGVPNWQSTPATAMPLVSDSGNSQNAAADPNFMNYVLDSTKSATWPAMNFTGCTVRLISGSGAGQVRTVTSNDATHLYVSPPWNFPDPNQPPYQTFAAPGYEVGWANDRTWCMKIRPASDATNWIPGNGTDLNHIVRGANPSAGWPLADLTGKYVYITGGAGAGQARAIRLARGNESADYANNLYVTPPFATPLDTTTTTYELMESHGYVLITSGRATNRLFPIVWDQRDQHVPPVEGHLIVCAGTDFTVLNGITAAQRGSQYNLQNATTFSVIGNQSPLAWPLGSIAPTGPMLLNAVPDGNAIGPAPTPPWPAAPWAAWPPPWFNTLNIVGHPNRLAADLFNGSSSASDYGYATIFSDSGTDPNLPVRVDVLVWRNFDINKDFAENQKPVGHMTGYIKRP